MDSGDYTGEQRSLPRRILPWLGLAVLAAALYDGYIFYSRRSGDQDREKQRAAQEAQQAKKLLDAVGGNDLKIFGFDARPPVIHRGAHTTLCYGVNGAKTVRLNPPVEEVWPAVTHCLEAAPKKDTEYTLTAEDGAGHSVSQAAIVRVLP
jgi:hypothetical protein